MAPLVLVAGLLAAFVQVKAQFQLFLEDGSLPTGADNTTACGKALQATINCNTGLQSALNADLDTTTTTSVCTSACYSSLGSYRSAIASACSGIDIAGDDITYPATFSADILLYSYNRYVSFVLRLIYIL